MNDSNQPIKIYGRDCEPGINIQWKSRLKLYAVVWDLKNTPKMIENIFRFRNSNIEEIPKIGRNWRLIRMHADLISTDNTHLLSFRTLKSPSQWAIQLNGY